MKPQTSIARAATGTRYGTRATLIATLALLLTLAVATTASAQYTPSAGKNAPAEAYEAETDDQGRVEYKRVKTAVKRDSHGNASGDQYDLAVDGAFDGQTVLILDQVGNTLVNTRASLSKKGLASVVYRHTLPSVKTLRRDLAKSCQLWLISSGNGSLTPEHIAVIKKFFDAGHGVYIWGDNDPLYADANKLASALVPGLGMEGNLYGDQVVGIADGKKTGLRQGHLITTGIENLYEGVTIATLQFGRKLSHDKKNSNLYNTAPLQTFKPIWSPRPPAGFTPLLHGSDGNLVSAAYEMDGKRLVIDGGFTRLAVNWDDAGTSRFVKNAAAWLVNSERFGEYVSAGKESHPIKAAR